MVVAEALLYFFSLSLPTPFKVHHVKHELKCSSAVSALYEKIMPWTGRGSNNQFSFFKIKLNVPQLVLRTGALYTFLCAAADGI